MKKINIEEAHSARFTFVAITLFYFFEAIQFGYFNVLAPSFLESGVYNHHQIAALSSAYMYGIIFGLIPVGLIDRYSIRKVLLWSIFGSVIGAFLLFVFDQYYLRWIARFICGFFGGAFSFVGGIRIVSLLFPKRFTYYLGMFLSAGTLGGLVCLYPLLIAIKHFGIHGAMAIVAGFGFIVMLFNVLYLHPKEDHAAKQVSHDSYKDWVAIIKNTRNLLDCIMIILLDTPVSILGTLWGIVILMNVFHLSSIISTWIMMVFFLGMLIGYPTFGVLADKFNDSKWIVFIGSVMSLLLVTLMILNHSLNVIDIFIVFLALGFFSTCQALGFTWLTKNMRPDLIGRNSAFNSMLFMGTNGGFKQFSAILLSLPPLIGHASGNNLLILIGLCMLMVSTYILFRTKK
jgi:predicted MFS family arabinose efflux permease